MPELKAAGDRVLLKFPPPVDKLRGVDVPDGWKLRPEIGELVSIGDGLSEETRRLAQNIREHAATGGRFLVPMNTGTYYWTKELGQEYEFLKDVRSYRITEIATFLVP